jgi:hypothetical protein
MHSFFFVPTVAFFCHSSQLLDLDVLACQTAMCALTADRFVSHALHRFALLRWVAQAGAANDDAMSDAPTAVVDDDAATPTLEAALFADKDVQRVFVTRLAELLRFFIIVVEDQCLIGHTSLEQCVEDEIVHRLWLGPLTHSALCVTLAYTDRFFHCYCVYFDMHSST